MTALSSLEAAVEKHRRDTQWLAFDAQRRFHEGGPRYVLGTQHARKRLGTFLLVECCACEPDGACVECDAA